MWTSMEQAWNKHGSGLSHYPYLGLFQGTSMEQAWKKWQYRLLRMFLTIRMYRFLRGSKILLADNSKEQVWKCTNPTYNRIGTSMNKNGTSMNKNDFLAQEWNKYGPFLFYFRLQCFVDASWKEGWSRRVTASETTSRCRGPSRERSGKDGPRRFACCDPRVFQSPAFTLTGHQPPIQSPYYACAIFSNPECSAWHAERRTKKKQNKKNRIKKSAVACYNIITLFLLILFERWVIQTYQHWMVALLATTPLRILL